MVALELDVTGTKDHLWIPSAIEPLPRADAFIHRRVQAIDRISFDGHVNMTFRAVPIDYKLARKIAEARFDPRNTHRVDIKRNPRVIRVDTIGIGRVRIESNQQQA